MSELDDGGMEKCVSANDRDLLVRIDTKLDAALNTLKDHEYRLRKVERFQWRIAGGSSVVGGLIAAFVSLIAQHGLK